MSGALRRTTALAIVAALVAGTLAAWLVHDFMSSVRNRDGSPVTIAVALAPIARGARVDDQLLVAAVGQRTIPRVFAPKGAVGEGEDLLGSVAAVDLPPGAYLTTADFSAAKSAGGTGFNLRRGERAVSVNALVAPDGADPSPGRQADLLASGIGGGSSTSLVLAGAEILAVSDASATQTQPLDGEDSSDGDAVPRRRITLRVSQAQAPSVVRADAFAKELRVLMLP